MKTFRLIRSQPGSAAYNMALDEKIFLRFMEDGIPVFRVYSWKTPSITYGISQHAEGEINLKQCNLDGLQIAQRITGGGVLFHGDEITYSLVCSKEDVGEEREAFVSYRQICAFLMYFYKTLGLNVCFALEADDFKSKSLPHRLCSASHEKFDIVIGGRKIGGNAQKRSRQVIFQHGSIPLKVNWEFVRRYIPALPMNISSQVTSLAEELESIPDKQILEQKLICALAHVYGVRFIEEKELLYAETSLA